MTIRYDFWSLIAALAEGLSHGNTTAAERAKGIVDALAKQLPGDRSKKERCLAVVVDYLAAIEKELATHPGDKTVEWK
jgi:hypothetical protein